MSEREFFKFLYQLGDDEGEGDDFISIVETLIEMLDEGDTYDAFGTEGWKHQFGWE